MARKAKRDLTMEEQLARGPLDLPFLMLVLLLLGIGLVMLFSASYYTAYRDPTPPVSNNPYFYIIRQAAFAGAGIVCLSGGRPHVSALGDCQGGGGAVFRRPAVQAGHGA